MSKSANYKNIITNSILHIDGNLHVGDIIYNINKDLQNTILFLRFQKEKATSKYIAHLEIKAKASIQNSYILLKLMN